MNAVDDGDPSVERLLGWGSAMGALAGVVWTVVPAYILFQRYPYYDALLTTLLVTMYFAAFGSVFGLIAVVVFRRMR